MLIRLYWLASRLARGKSHGTPSDSRLRVLLYQMVWVASFAGICLGDDSTPLHVRIDEAIRAAYDGPMAPRSDDAEFLRRVYLDLTGSIPDAEAARLFLNDPSSDKRQQLIDRLLSSPQYARHMATVFDVMWMERRGGNRVSPDEWRRYLRDAFAKNRPLNELAGEILAADGARRGPRAAARFYLDRDAETNLLTRDVARLFFGKSLQCAQCHDHPLVDGYVQEDYYGLYAFLSRGYLVSDKNLKLDVYAEKADGDVKYQSVFMPEETHETRPHLPGQAPIDEPDLKEDEQYEVPPADKVAAVPKYSRRERLGRLIAEGASRDFAENMVNRLWAMMMGRGLVEPVGWHHEDNPPSHPALLTLLTDAFVASRFDVRWFLRELAFSETYQRSSLLPEGVDPQSIPEDRFAVATLKPLTPEQLAWSMMQATGIADTRKVQVAQKFRSEDPRYDDLLNADPPRQAIKATLLDERLYTASKGDIGRFVGLFSGLPGEPEEYQANVQQALFLSNDGKLLGWLSPSHQGGQANLAARLAQLETPAAVAEELYLSILTRHPDNQERALVAELLTDQSPQDRQALLRDLAWALLTSTEFSFNH